MSNPYCQFHFRTSLRVLISARFIPDAKAIVGRARTAAKIGTINGYWLFKGPTHTENTKATDTEKNTLIKGFSVSNCLRCFIITNIETNWNAQRAIGAISVAEKGSGRKMMTKNTIVPISRDLVYNFSFSIPISVNVNMLLIIVRTKYPNNI